MIFYALPKSDARWDGKLEFCSLCIFISYQFCAKFVNYGQILKFYRYMPSISQRRLQTKAESQFLTCSQSTQNLESPLKAQTPVHQDFFSTSPPKYQTPCKLNIFQSHKRLRDIAISALFKDLLQNFRNKFGSKLATSIQFA